MPIDRRFVGRLGREESGFTAVEMISVLALVGISLLALMKVQDVLQRSVAQVGARTDLIEMRNLVGMTLARRSETPGRSICGEVLTLLDGRLPNFSPPSYPEFKDFDPGMPADPANPRVPVAIRSGTEASGALTTLIRTGDVRRTDSSIYDAFLLGKFRSRTRAEDHYLYGGWLKIVARRKGVALNDQNVAVNHIDALETKLPIQFEVDSSGKLVDCRVRSNERTIGGGTNTLDDCSKAGGTVVSTEQGNFCRFFLPDTTGLASIPCPGEGWTALSQTNSGTLCGLTPNYWPHAEPPPDCPNPPSYPDPGMGQGSRYCKVDGTAVGGKPKCPDVPDLDPADYDPGDLIPAWEEVPGSYDPPTSYSVVCKYNQPCAGQEVVQAGQYYCLLAAPTSCPTDWIEQSTKPLTCFASLGVAPALALQCRGNFKPVDPPIGDWNDSHHVLCF